MRAIVRACLALGVGRLIGFFGVAIGGFPVSLMDAWSRDRWCFTRAFWVLLCAVHDRSGTEVHISARRRKKFLNMAKMGTIFYLSGGAGVDNGMNFHYVPALISARNEWSW